MGPSRRLDWSPAVGHAAGGVVPRVVKQCRWYGPQCGEAVGHTAGVWVPVW